MNPASQTSYEYWTLALKLVSVTVSGTLGTIALLNDFKDTDGKLTKWGKITLLGLVLSAVVDGDPFSYLFTPNNRKGVELLITVHPDGSQTATELRFGPHPALFLTGKQWDNQLFSGAFREVSIWKSAPAISRCGPAIGPDLVLDFDSSDREGTSNTYIPREDRIQQNAMVHLRRKEGADKGTIISTLDLENSLMKLSFVVPEGKVTRELKFCTLTITLGHLTVAIDPEHLTQCGSDVFVRFPTTFSLGGPGPEHSFTKDDLCAPPRQVIGPVVSQSN